MKQLNILLFVIILCSYYHSCQESFGDKLKSTESIISLDSIRRSVYYSDVFEDISFVVLHDLPEDEAISHFGKIIKFEEGYICWEDQLQSIFIFDNHGKYVRKIKNTGKGPTEYMDISNVCYSETEKSLYVIDVSLFLIRYNIEGKGMSKIQLPKRTGDFISNFTGELIFHSYPKAKAGTKEICVIWKLISDKSLNCLDLNLNKINAYSWNSQFKFAGSIKSNLLIFSAPLSDVIYEIRNNGIYLKYRIDFGKRNIMNSTILSEKSFNGYLNYLNGDEKFIFNQGKNFVAKEWIILTMFNNYYKDDHSKSVNEYILYNPKFGVFSSNQLKDNQLMNFAWRIKGAHDNVLIHHMYYQDVERIIEEGIDLRTENGGRVLDQLDATSEVLMLMKLKTADSPF